jgi:hypothetical protein
MATGLAVKISASIMAHPDRAEQVDTLRRELGLSHGVTPVYWDNQGPPSGNGDRVWRTARGAWSLFDPDADYHVLIQDDAMPCADYLAGLERALEHMTPGAIASPYLGTGRMAPARWATLARMADAADASWVRGERVMWGVSLAVPTSDIPAMINWCDQRGGVPDDMRVGGWAKRNNREVWYTWPSLVDHRLVPSLTKHRAADRVARKHHSGSALDLRWDGPVVTDPMLMRRTGHRSGPSSNRKVTLPRVAISRKGRNGA